jgi:tetratricopeptide (TPR) repeat protein
MKTRTLACLIALVVCLFAVMAVVVSLVVRSLVVDVVAYRDSESSDRADLDKAIRHYSWLILFNPRNANAYHWRIYAYERKGDWDHAIRDCDAALRLNSRDTWALNNRGFAYASKGQFTKAIADYTQSLSISGPDAEVLAYRGTAYGQQSEFEKALHDFDAAIKLNPTNATAYVSRGWAYAQNKKPDEALQDFDEGIRLGGGAEAYSYRGHFYAREGDWEAAIADHRRALALAEDTAAAQNALAWLLATAPSPEFRKGVEAIDLATKACESTQWKIAEYLDTLAAAHAESGSFGQAIKFQKQALDSLPKYSSERNRMQQRFNLYQSHQAYRTAPGYPEH